MGERKGVFVTVGTTSFDKLVEAVYSAPVKEALFRRGFSHHESFIKKIIVKCCFHLSVW
jgi:UDP-N-acetylglucosamine transferase subunit ALG13